MSAAQKDPDRSQTATLPEHDLPTRPITQDDMARMIGAVMDERAKAVPQSPGITGKQWTAIGSGLVAVLGIFGGANYAGVAQLTAAEVTQQDEANKKIVRGEFDRSATKLYARIDADRATFKSDIGEIKDDLATIKKDASDTKTFIEILKDRDARK